MKEKFKYAKDLFLSKEMGIMPAGLAFSLFFAVIPIISIIFYLLTSFHFSLDALENFLSNTFPQGVAKLLQPVLIEDLSLSSLITLIVGLGVTINGCLSITIASNTIYEIENAPYHRRLIKAFLLTIIMVFLLAFIVVVPLLGNSFIKLLGNLGTFVSDNLFLINTIYTILQVPFSMIVIFFLIKLLYTIAPDQKIEHKYTNKGALFTTFMWLILTIVFSYYINNIARYDLVYGNLANIVILMFWFYLLAYVFIIGIIINRDVRDITIEKTNTIKLEELRDKVKDNIK